MTRTSTAMAGWPIFIGPDLIHYPPTPITNAERMRRHEKLNMYAPHRYEDQAGLSPARGE